MKNKDSFTFFCQPKIISGKTALANIQSELEGMNASRPMVILESRLARTGAIKMLSGSLADSGIPAKAIFDEVKSMARYSEILRAAEIFRSNGCDSLIAFGSSPVLDTARGINMIVSSGENDIRKFAGTDMIRDRLCPMISIPLLPYRGTYTSNRANIDSLIYSSDYLFPDTIIIDTKTAILGPGTGLVENGIYSLGTCIDASTGEQANPAREAYINSAVGLISQNLMNIKKRPKNKRALISLTTGASIAGIVSANSNTGFVLTLVNSISAETEIPSGYCMAAILPYSLSYLSAKGRAGSGSLLLTLSGHEAYSVTPKKQRVEVIIAMLLALFEDLCVQSSLKRIKISEYMLEKIALNAAGSGPAGYKAADYMAVLMRSREGQQIIEKSEALWTRDFMRELNQAVKD